MPLPKAPLSGRCVPLSRTQVWVDSVTQRVCLEWLAVTVSLMAAAAPCKSERRVNAEYSSLKQGARRKQTAGMEVHATGWQALFCPPCAQQKRCKSLLVCTCRALEFAHRVASDAYTPRCSRTACAGRRQASERERRLCGLGELREVQGHREGRSAAVGGCCWRVLLKSREAGQQVNGCCPASRAARPMHLDHPTLLPPFCLLPCSTK